ncbi:uncharacterized protein LOC106667307 [Cimex lectularius]|uniref:Odorant receptor n=1 Tax=Cimex lectularius TaxID=79782 RepID=A0A8I6SRX2_CIMLE|nr:uncharacterized protein LOC106667307 [Cimex lectularius]
MIIVCILFMVKYRSVYSEIDRIIKSGVYDYGEDFTEEQQSICEGANKLVLKLGKLLTIAFIATVSTSLTKQTIFRRKPGSWNTLFKGWTPFVINTWPRYLIVFIVHIIMIINTSTSGYLLVLSFLTFGVHLVAQLKSLRIALQEIFLSEKNQSEEQILAKLKKCAAHHAEITRFFNLVQVYSGSVSGVLPIGSVGMICTFLYDMTGENTVEASFMVILPEASLITTYALIGQYITNEEVNFSVGKFAHLSLRYRLVRPTGVRPEISTADDDVLEEELGLEGVRSVQVQPGRSNRGHADHLHFLQCIERHEIRGNEE